MKKTEAAGNIWCTSALNTALILLKAFSKLKNRAYEQACKGDTKLQTTEIQLKAEKVLKAKRSKSLKTFVF